MNKIRAIDAFKLENLMSIMK